MEKGGREGDCNKIWIDLSGEIIVSSQDYWTIWTMLCNLSLFSIELTLKCISYLSQKLKTFPQNKERYQWGNVMTCLILVPTANLTDVEIEREISWSELRMTGAISSDHSDVTRGGHRVVRLTGRMIEMCKQNKPQSHRSSGPCTTCNRQGVHASGHITWTTTTGAYVVVWWDRHCHNTIPTENRVALACKRVD